MPQRCTEPQFLELCLAISGVRGRECPHEVTTRFLCTFLIKHVPSIGGSLGGLVSRTTYCTRQALGYCFLVRFHISTHCHQFLGIRAIGLPLRSSDPALLPNVNTSIPASRSSMRARLGRLVGTPPLNAVSAANKKLRRATCPIQMWPCCGICLSYLLICTPFARPA